MDHIKAPGRSKVLGWIGSDKVSLGLYSSARAVLILNQYSIVGFKS